MPNTKTQQTHRGCHQPTFAHLLEIYVDKFLQAAQTTDEALLRHQFASFLPDIVHPVFPPPKWTRHTGTDPVHPKKTRLAGTWQFTKEIHGWMIDGIQDSIVSLLPTKKIGTLIDALQELLPNKATRPRTWKHADANNNTLSWDSSSTTPYGPMAQSRSIPQTMDSHNPSHAPG